MSLAAFSPRLLALALEPRLLFDGAAAVTVVDHAVSPDHSFDAAERPMEGRAVENDAGAEAAPAQQTADVLLVVDARVADHQSLVAHLPPNVALLVVDADHSGLTAVESALSRLENIQSVQIVSHGAAGEFSLGADKVDEHLSSTQAAQLAAWGTHLSQDADILLYGCDIAQGERGGALLAQLAALTGADIAASTNATGAAAKGGDWNLEAATGPIESTFAVSAAARAGYGELMAAPAATETIEPRTVQAIEQSTLVSTDKTSFTLSKFWSGVTADTGKNVTVSVAFSTASDPNLSNLFDASGKGHTGSTIKPGSTDIQALSFTGSQADASIWLTQLKFNTPENLSASVNTRLYVQVALADSLTTFTTRYVDFTITPANDPPVIAGAPLQVSEGLAQALSLAQLAPGADDTVRANNLDPDIASGQQVLAQLMMKITSLPNSTKGELRYNGALIGKDTVIAVKDIDKLTYTHIGGDRTSNDSDSFNVTVTDGGGGSTDGTITITITPKNVAPTIDTPQHDNKISIIEGETKAIAPTINFGDDFDKFSNAKIEITNLDAGNQGYFSWNGTKITGTTLTLNPGEATNFMTNFKFVHNGEEPLGSGKTAPSYQIKVTDAGGGAGESAKLAVTKTITLAVSPNNDDPTLSAHQHNSPTGTGNDAPLELNEGTFVTLTEAMLTIADVDILPGGTAANTPKDQLVYTLTAAPVWGELQLKVGSGSNTSWDSSDYIPLGVNGRFSQQDLEAGKVRFFSINSVSADKLDKFSFNVTDSAFGFDTWNHTENPTQPREGGLRANPEDANLATKDFYFTIKNVSNGLGDLRSSTVKYDFNGNGLTNQGKSTWNERLPTESDNKYTITDEMLKYDITRTRTIDGTEQAPTLLAPEEIIYSLTKQPENGWLERDTSTTSTPFWERIQLTHQFTQQEINDGKVRFKNDGSEIHRASFDFKVSDGTTLGTTTGTFNIDVTPSNDRPTATGSETAVVVEGDAATNLAANPGSVVYLDASHFGMADADGSLQANGNEDPAKQATEEGRKDPLWFKVSVLPAEISDSAKTHGKLQRWNGSSWVDVNTTDWLSKDLLTTGCDGKASGLRYVHDGSEPLTYSGGPKLAFSFTVRDDLNAPANCYDTDNSTVTSETVDIRKHESTAATVTIAISPMNNPPQIADKPSATDPSITDTILNGGEKTGENQILTMSEGATAVIGKTLLCAIDTDNTTVQRQFRITTAPMHGQILKNGSVLGVGSTFTQDDINTGKISYRHDGTEPGTTTQFGDNGADMYHDKFHFIVDDGDKRDDGDATHNNVFLIQFTTLTNDPPKVTTSKVNWDITDTAQFSISTFTITDPDLDNGVQSGESNYIRAVVRLSDVNGNFLTTSGDYTSSNIKLAATPSGSATSGNSMGYLVITGSRTDVQNTLNNLKVNATDVNTDGNYKLQVIVDDRTRTGGVLDNHANGGETNQALANGTIPAIRADEPDYYNAFNVADAAHQGNFAQTTLNLRVTGTNNTFSMTGVPDTLMVNEDVATKITSGSTFALTDLESTTFGLPVSVTVTLPTGQGTLTAGGLTSGVTATAVTDGVKLTGTVAALNTYLQSADTATGLFYRSATNNNADQNSGDGDVTLTWTLDEGTALINTGSASTQINGGTINATFETAITITAVNDAPGVTLPAGPVNVTSTSAVTVSGVQLTDTDAFATPENPGEADQTGTVRATVRLLDASNNPITDYSKVTFSYNTGVGAKAYTNFDGANRVLDLYGTRAQLNDALGGGNLTVTFADGAPDAAYKLQLLFDDRLRDGSTGALSSGANGGTLNQNTANNGTEAISNTELLSDRNAATPTAIYNIASQTVTLNVSLNNDPPENKLPTGFSVTEDSKNNQVKDGSNNFITISDPDDFGANLTVKLTVANGTLSIDAQSGVTGANVTNQTTITLTGSKANLNAVLQTLTFTPTANLHGATGIASIQVETTDTDLGGVTNQTDTDTLKIAITTANDRPAAATDVTLTAIDEGSAPVGAAFNTLAFGYSDATDDKSSISNTVDSNTVTGDNTATGFSYLAITDNAATAAQGTWQVLKDSGNANTPADWINIPASGLTPANALVFKSTQLVRFVPATGYSGTPGSLTVRLGDQSSNLDSNVSDSASATKDLASVGSINSATGSWNDTNRTIGITVNAINDAPTLTGLTNKAFTEGGAAVVIGESAVPGDPELTNFVGNTGNWGNAFVQVQRNGGANPNDVFGVTSSTVSLSGTDIKIGGTTVGAVTTNTGGALKITFAEGATTAQVQQVMQAITYTNTRQDLGAGSTETVTLTWTLDDGDTDADRSTNPQGVGGHKSVSVDQNVTVNGANDAPTANDDTGSVRRDATLTVAAGVGVITNDTDPDTGATLTVTAIRTGAEGGSGTSGAVGSALAGAYGKLTLNTDGSYTYTPDSSNSTVANLGDGQTLTDSFTYTVSDGKGGTDKAQLTITIKGYTYTPPNDHPDAKPDSYTTPFDTPLTGSVKGNDTPSADGGNVWTLSTPPAHGTLVFNPDGSFVYTPAPGYSGTDSFTYTVTDKDGDTSTARVDLTVKPQNHLPAAVPDRYTTPLDTPVSGKVADNDTPSPDGGNVWTLSTPPAHGTLVFNPDGSFVYTPAPGYSGADSFTYTVTDKDGDTASAVVTISVTPPASPTPEPTPEPTPPEPTPPEPTPPEPTPPEPTPPEPTPPEPTPPEPTPPEPTPPEPTPPEPTPDTPYIPPPEASPFPAGSGTDPAKVSPEPLTQTPGQTVWRNPAPQLDDQVREPSVFFDGDVFTRMPRLPLPLHPIVYVTNAVAEAQDERGAHDALMMYGTSAADSPLFGNEGRDPELNPGVGLYVQTAVRSSQRQAAGALRNPPLDWLKEVLGADTFTLAGQNSGGAELAKNLDADPKLGGADDLANEKLAGQLSAADGTPETRTAAEQAGSTATPRPAGPKPALAFSEQLRQQRQINRKAAT